MDFLAVRGGGDLASGTIHRLFASGYRILVLNVTDLRQSGERWLSARQCMTELLL